MSSVQSRLPQIISLGESPESETDEQNLVKTEHRLRAKFMIKKIATFILCVTAINTTGADELKDSIRAMLANVTDGVDAVNIAETPATNIMKVELSNGKFVYVTRDAQFIFPGEMLQHSERGLVNLTERDLMKKRKTELNSVELAETITFKAKDEEMAEVYVFTDVSCGYCKKLHMQIEEINKAGITVHYLAFPRAGAQSTTGKLMTGVWCAQDRRRALTTAKEGGAIKQSSHECGNPVLEQYELGLRLGITGTPGIYDSSGKHLGGYLTTDQLRNAVY